MDFAFACTSNTQRASRTHAPKFVIVFVQNSQFLILPLSEMSNTQHTHTQNYSIINFVTVHISMFAFHLIYNKSCIWLQRIVCIDLYPQ